MPAPSSSGWTSWTGPPLATSSPSSPRDNDRLRQASEAEQHALYEETGGNPLLIRWVAGQLGLGRCRTIAAALDFLRSAPPGNDPLEFIFGDLLDTFTANETKVLAALTYFTIAMEVKFIAELASLNEAAAHGALSDLSSRALVLPDLEERRFALVPMVADFLRRKRPEVVAETGSRLEERAYALIVENGYDKHDRFPVLDAAWPTVAPALPLFVAGPNPRLQTVCDALADFLDFTGRWDEWLSLSQQAEAKAVAAGDHDNAGWRAYQAGWVHYLREQADAVLACADRAAAHWQTGLAGARERAIAIHMRGVGYRLKADYPAAIAAYREALDLGRSLSAESEDVAIALNDLADAEQLSGDLAAAERDYREALRVARAVGYAEGVATYTGNLAELALDREDWPGAETLAREALPLSEKVGRQELIACRLPPPRQGPSAAGKARRSATLRPTCRGDLHRARLARTRRSPRDNARVRVLTVRRRLGVGTLTQRQESGWQRNASTTRDYGEGRVHRRTFASLEVPDVHSHRRHYPKPSPTFRPSVEGAICNLFADDHWHYASHEGSRRRTRGSARSLL